MRTLLVPAQKTEFHQIHILFGHYFCSSFTTIHCGLSLSHLEKPELPDLVPFRIEERNVTLLAGTSSELIPGYFSGRNLSYRISYRLLEDTPVPVRLMIGIEADMGWSFYEREDKGIEISSPDGKWTVYYTKDFGVPLVWEDLGTMREFNYLLNNRTYFSDNSGDSMMSNSYSKIWFERLNRLSILLGINR